MGKVRGSSDLKPHPTPPPYLGVEVVVGWRGTGKNKVGEMLSSGWQVVRKMAKNLNTISRVFVVIQMRKEASG